jgi:hypothetical protein
MKDQYFGDINDYRKYALLLELSGGGEICTGVCWMLTEADGRTDGSALGYLTQAERFRGMAPAIFDLLHQVVMIDKDRRVARLENAGELPNSIFHSLIIPDDREGRTAYFREASVTLTSADWVFFDPDNGLEVPSIPLGRKGSSKFLYWHEVEATYRAGQSVLIYQHFPRKQRVPYVDALAAALAKRTGGKVIFAFRTTRVAFFLAPQAHHIAHFRSRAFGVIGRWRDHVVVTEHLFE